MAGDRDTGPCFYCADLPDTGGKGGLEEEETHHASASRRVRVGDTIDLIDGAGSRAVAVVESVARNQLAFTVRERRKVAAPEPAIIIASAVPKGERFRTLIDMSSQIGVAGIIPLICERSTVKPRRSSGQRWQRIAIEACKQSRNPYIPVIHPAQDIAASLDGVPADGTIAVADAVGEAPRKVVPASGFCYFYIGPEGGFTDAERQLLLDHGARMLTLGDNILRVETAAVVAAAFGRAAGR